MNQAYRVLAVLALVTSSVAPRTLLAAAAEGGSNNGSSGKGSVYMIEQCKKSQVILKSYMLRAETAIQQEDMSKAKDLLLEGLMKAADANRDDAEDSSLTHKALTRGVEIGNALEQVAPQNVEQVVAYLRSYYELVGYISHKLDIPFLIPDKYRTPNTEAPNRENFEVPFVKYASLQLSKLMSAFVDTSTDQPSVKGNVKAYLKALEYVALYTQQDLGASYWADKYSDEIETLSVLNQALRAHNGGNMEFYLDDRNAFYITHRQSNEVMSSFRAVTDIRSHR
jgi:hypothetical protein